ncbi:16855_t:CDS:2, partial [Funneliformis mosseae]
MTNGWKEGVLMSVYRCKGRFTKQASYLFLILEEIKKESSLREHLMHGNNKVLKQNGNLNVNYSK